MKVGGLSELPQGPSEGPDELERFLRISLVCLAQMICCRGFNSPIKRGRGQQYRMVRLRHFVPAPSVNHLFHIRDSPSATGRGNSVRILLDPEPAERIP